MLIAYTALVAGATLLFTVGVISGMELDRNPDYDTQQLPRKSVTNWMLAIATAVLLSVPLL